jgi:hypothetical protein
MAFRVGLVVEARRGRLGVLVLLCAASSRGQINTGEIGGSVKDAAGGLIVGASVVAERAATGLKYPTVTNNAGDPIDSGSIPLFV